MNVRMPDGSLIRNVPEGTTKADLFSKLKAAKHKSVIDIEPTQFNAAEESQRVKQKYGGPVTLQNVPQIKADRGVSQQFYEETQKAVGEFEARKRAAEAGVALDEKAPISSVKIGLGNQPQEAIRSLLTDHLKSRNLLGPNEEAQLRIGEESGQLEWLDPVAPTEKAKWKVLNLDALSKAGFALPIAGDIAGTLLGGAVGSKGGTGGMIAGEGVGSAVGTATGELFRLAFGRMLGANDMSTTEMFVQSLGQGALAGGITVTVGGVTVGAKHLYNFLNGFDFSKSAAIRAGMSAEEAKATIRELNNILFKGGKSPSVKPDVAQLTNDPNMLALKKEIETKSDYARRFAQNQARNEQGVKEALETVTERATTGPSMPLEEASKRMKAALNKRLDQAKEVVAANVKQLDDIYKGIDAAIPESVGANFRPVLAAKRKLESDAVDAAYTGYKALVRPDEVTGLTGIKLPLSERFINLRDRFKREAGAAITKITRQKKGGIFGASDEVLEEQKAERFLADWLGEDPKKISGRKYDLSELNAELSSLKQAARTSTKNGTLTDPQAGDLKQVISALEESRNTALMAAGKQDVLSALLEAEEKRRVYAELYERSIVGQMLQESSPGVWKVKNPDLMKSVLNASGEELDVLLRVVGDNSQAIQAVRKAIGGDFKSIASQGRREIWLESHKELLERFFTKDQIKQMSSVNGFEQVIAKQEAQLKKMLANAQKVWGRGKLTSLDPEKMVDFVTNNSSTVFIPSSAPGKAGLGTTEVYTVAEKKVKWLKAWMNEINPAGWRGFQSKYAERIKSTVLKDGAVDARALGAVLNKQSDLLQTVFGKKYVKDLNTVLDSMKILSREGKLLRGDEALEAAMQALRGIEQFRPLSLGGKRLTSVLIFGKKVNHDRVANSLLDPDAMAKVAEIVEHSKITRETLELAASVGIILSAQQVEQQ